MKNYLIKLTHDQFNLLGFTKEEWYDKNHSKDPFNTLKFIKYIRPVIDNHVDVEVSFTFISDDGINYKQIEAVEELRVGTEYLPLNENLITELTEFLKLIAVVEVTSEKTEQKEQLLTFAKWLDEDTITGLIGSPNYYVERFLSR